VENDDLLKLWNDYKEVIKITPEKKLAILKRIKGKELIILDLSAAYIANKMGIFEKPSLSLKEIWNSKGLMSDITKKTLQNNISNLIKNGIIERDSSGDLFINEVAVLQFADKFLNKFLIKGG
jgi:hypothetical protein